LRINSCARHQVSECSQTLSPCNIGNPISVPKRGKLRDAGKLPPPRRRGGLSRRGIRERRARAGNRGIWIAMGPWSQPRHHARVSGAQACGPQPRASATPRLLSSRIATAPPGVDGPSTTSSLPVPECQKETRAVTRETRLPVEPSYGCGPRDNATKSASKTPSESPKISDEDLFRRGPIDLPDRARQP
jgi:hypothetical protein